MSFEVNKALVRSFFEKANREGGTPVEMCAPGFTAHIGATPAMDLQAFQKYQKAYYAGFSDSRTTIDDILAEGDRVAFRGVVTAIHSGEFMGIKGSSRQIVVPIIGFARIATGRIAEWWNSPDRLSWMQQIGALPEPVKARRTCK